MAKKIKHRQQRIPQAKKPVAVPVMKKFSFATPTEKNRVLHIGWCSAVSNTLHTRFKSDEWQEIRLDQDASAKPDILSPLTDMKDVPDQSVDAIWAQHILQRFVGMDVLKILAECKRVLKPNGYFLLSVPDGQSAAAYVANSRGEEALFQTPVGGICALDLIYGFRQNIQKGLPHQQHHSLFTAEKLGLMMRDAGLTNIRLHRRATFDILAIGYNYAYDHPERAEKVEIIQDTKTTPATPTLPAHQQQPLAAQPVQYLKGPLGLSDELNIPPGQWKALGLKNTK